MIKKRVITDAEAKSKQRLKLNKTVNTLNVLHSRLKTLHIKASLKRSVLNKTADHPCTIVLSVFH